MNRHCYDAACDHCLCTARAASLQVLHVQAWPSARGAARAVCCNRSEMGIVYYEDGVPGLQLHCRMLSTRSMPCIAQCAAE